MSGRGLGVANVCRPRRPFRLGAALRASRGSTPAGGDTHRSPVGWGKLSVSRWGQMKRSKGAKPG